MTGRGRASTASSSMEPSSTGRLAVVVAAILLGCVSCRGDSDPDRESARGEAASRDSGHGWSDGDLHATDTAETARVAVDFTRVERAIPRTLFGYNSLWMFAGMGLWSVSEDAPDPEVLAEVERLGVGLLRYPGGTVSHTFHWSEAIGPVDERRPQTIPFLEDERFAGLVGGAEDRPVFGPDEFLELCERASIEPLLVCAFEEGTPEEAAAWVAYVNGDPTNETKIGVDANGRDWGTVGSWAARRVANGRVAPWGVRWFEIGNELDLVRFRRTAEAYADAYLAYRAAMRAVDPTILLGAVGHAIPGGVGHEDRLRETGHAWNATLFERCGERLDLLCLHFYANHDDRRDDALDVLADPIAHARAIAEIAESARGALGRDLPIAVTEHAMDERSSGENAGAGNASLRAAIVVADSLVQFARQGVEIAGLHVLRLKWGGAANPFLHFASMLEWKGRRTFAPQYHVVRLMTEYVLKEQVACDVDATVFRPQFEPSLEVPYVSGLASRGSGRHAVVLVNKHPARTVRVTVEMRGANEGVLDARCVRGHGPDANNAESETVAIHDHEVVRHGDTLIVDLPALCVVGIALGER